MHPFPLTLLFCEVQKVSLFIEPPPHSSKFASMFQGTLGNFEISCFAEGLHSERGAAHGICGEAGPPEGERGSQTHNPQRNETKDQLGLRDPGRLRYKFKFCNI